MEIELPSYDEMRAFCERLFAETDERKLDTLIGEAAGYLEVYATVLRDQQEEIARLTKEADDHAEAASRWRARAGELADWLEVAIEDYDSHNGKSNIEAHWSNQARRALSQEGRG